LIVKTLGVTKSAHGTNATLAERRDKDTEGARKLTNPHNTVIGRERVHIGKSRAAKRICGAKAHQASEHWRRKGY